MAADETNPLYQPTPRKRGRAGRAPPVIEGEAVEAAEAAPPAQPEAGPEPEQARETASEAAPEAAPEHAPEPAAERTPEPAAEPPAPAPAAPEPAADPRLPLIGAVLIGALGLGSGLFGAWQAQNGASEINELRAEVVSLRARGAPAAAASDQLAAMERRIAALEQRPVPAPAAPSAVPPATPAVNPAELRALADRVSALDGSLKTVGESAANALQTARRAAEASAKPPPPPVDLQPLDKRLAALEAREAPMAAMARRTEAAGLAVVAASLARALEQGAPFEPALAAAASLGVEAGRLAPLQSLARTGAPTARSLSRLWAEDSRAALDAVRPAEAGEGWLDRLKASAARLVQVRPVGEAAGEDPAALGANIEAALTRGAVAQALAAWTRLPEPARAASRRFGDAARQLVAAQEAVEAMTAGAVADLARSKGAP